MAIGGAAEWRRLQAATWRDYGDCSSGQASEGLHKLTGQVIWASAGRGCCGCFSRVFWLALRGATIVVGVQGRLGGM